MKLVNSLKKLENVLITGPQLPQGQSLWHWLNKHPQNKAQDYKNICIYIYCKTHNFGCP